MTEKKTDKKKTRSGKGKGKSGGRRDHKARRKKGWKSHK